MCSRAAALGTLRDLGQLRLRDFPDDVFPRLHIAPTDPMPIVHAAPAGNALALAAWGKPGTELSTTHARSDRVGDSPLWQPLASSRGSRAVAIVTHGWEPFTTRTISQMGRDMAIANVGSDAVRDAEAGTTVWHGFRRRDGGPLMLAALTDVAVRDGGQSGAAAGGRWMALVTVPSGPVLARVHRAKESGEPREAALLRSAAEALDWMEGGDAALLRGATDAELEWWRAPDGCMGKDVDPLIKTQTWVQKQRRLF